MKNNKKLLSILLTVVMLVSVLSVAAAAADADNVIYLKPNSNWAGDGARFAAYFWNDSGDTWVSMTDANNDGTYEVTVPSGYSNVIFCRMNPANAENKWDEGYKWNQTADLTVPTDSNVCYALAEGAWDRGAGAWGALGAGAPVVNPTFEGYCVAGSASLCGAEWDTTAGINVMSLNASGVYELTIYNVAAGEHKFKVSTYDWGKDAPESDYVLTLTEASDVTIYYNEATNEVTVSTAAADPSAIVYYVAGSANLCGSEWKENDANNAMTLNSDGLMEKVYTNLGGGEYKFKITAGNWNSCWGVEADENNPDGNVVFNLDEGDLLNLTILFNPETYEIETYFEPVDNGGGNGGENEGGNAGGNGGENEGGNAGGNAGGNVGDNTNPDNGDNTYIFVMVGFASLMAVAAVAVVGKKQLF